MKEGGREKFSNELSQKVLTDDLTDIDRHLRWKIFAGSFSFSLSDDSSW
jgi:hypothetical protein